jgi:hypothetical protein
LAIRVLLLLVERRSLLKVYHESILGEIANLIRERLPADAQRFLTSYVAVYDRCAHFTSKIEELTTNCASEPVLVPLLHYPKIEINRLALFFSGSSQLFHSSISERCVILVE